MTPIKGHRRPGLTEAGYSKRPWFCVSPSRPVLPRYGRAEARYCFRRRLGHVAS